MSERIGLNIDVQFQKQQEVAKNLQSILDYTKKNTSFEIDLDMKNVNKSLGNMGKVLSQLKTQLSNFGVLDSVVNTTKVNESTLAITKETQALKERKKIVEDIKMIKTATTSIINKNGEESITKELEVIQDEYGKIIQTVDKYSAKTGKLKSTVVTVTDEIEKQRLAQEKLNNELAKQINKESEARAKSREKNDNTNRSQEEKLKKQIEYNEIISLGNKELEERKRLEKLESNIDKFKNISQPKLDIARDNNLIDNSVITELQSKLNSINTNTASNEIIELKRDIDRLSSGDSGIVRVTNEINKLQNNLNKTKGKYGDLVGGKDTINELKQVEIQLLKLKSIQKDMENGTYIDGKKLSSEINQGTDAMRRLETATKNSNDSLRLATKDASTFGDAFRDIATKVGLVSVAYTAMNKVTDSFRFGMTTVVAMDDALTDLNKVVDMSKTGLDSMKDSAIEMGKNLSKSSIEIAKAQAEFGRLYKDAETINKMTEASIIGSNVMDNTTSQEVAKGLTTVMTAMKLETTDAMMILDSMNEVQNNYRISADGMLEAMAKVGSTATVTGLSIQELEGYITAMTVATGKSGDEVGNSIKSLTARIYKIGSEGMEAQGKPEKMLNDMGVAVRNAGGEFLELDTILNSLDTQWKNMSETEKIATSQVVAGQHKYNDFIALMNNYDMALNATKTALNSMGSASAENEIYLESISARMESLKVTSEEFWLNFINSDAVKGSITILQSLMEGLIGLENTFGGTALSVGVLSSAFLMFTNNPLKAFAKGLVEGEGASTTLGKSLKALNTTFTTTKSSMGGLSAVSSTASAGFKMLGASALFAQVKVVALQVAMSLGLSLAITATISIITKLCSSLSDTSSLMDGTSESATALANSLKDMDNDTDIVSQYEKLNNKLKDANNTAEEQKQIQSEIATIKNQLSTDESYGWIINSNKSLEEQLELMRQVRDEKIRDQAIELEDNMPSQRKAKKEVVNLDNDIRTYDNLVKAMENVDSQGRVMFEGSKLRASDLQDRINELEGEIKSSSLSIEEYNANIELMDRAGIKHNRTTIEFSEAQKNTKTAIEDSNKKIQENTDKLNDNTDAKGRNSGVQIDSTTPEVDTQSITDAVTKYNELNDSATKVNEIIAKMNDEQGYTPQIMGEVLALYPELSSSISDSASVQEFLNGKVEEMAQQANASYLQMVGDDEMFYANKFANNSEWEESFRQSLIGMGISSQEAYNFDLTNFSTLNQLKDGVLSKFGGSVNSWLSQFVDTSINGYNIDINNFRSAAEAKAAILDALNQEIAKVTNNLAKAGEMATFASQQQKLLGHSEGSAKGKLDSYMFDQSTSDVEKYANQLKGLNGAINQVNTSFGNMGASMSGFTPSGSFGGGGGSSSGLKPSGSSGSSAKEQAQSNKEKEKEVALIEDLTDVYYDLNSVLNDYQVLLSENNALQDIASEKDLIVLKEKEVELLKKQKQATENLRNEEKKQLENMKKSSLMNNFKYDSDGDITNRNQVLDDRRNHSQKLSGEEREIYQNYTKEIEKTISAYDSLNSKVEEHNIEVLKLETSIQSALTEQTKVVIDKIKDEISEISETIAESISDLDFDIGMIASTNASATIELNINKIQLQRKELELTKKKLEELKKTNATTKEGEKALADAIKETTENLETQSQAIANAKVSLEKLGIRSIIASIDKIKQETQEKLSDIDFQINVVIGNTDATKTQELEIAKIQVQRKEMEATRKKLEELKNMTATTKEGQYELSNSIADTEKTLKEQSQAIQDAKGKLESYAVSLQQSAYKDKMWQLGTQQMNKIEFEISGIKDDDSVKMMDLLNQKLAIQQGMVSETEKYLAQLRNTTVTTSEGYEALVKQIKEAEEALNGQESALQSVQQQMDNIAKSKIQELINQQKELAKLELAEKQKAENKVLEDGLFKVDKEEYYKYKELREKNLADDIAGIKAKLALDKDNLALQEILKGKELELNAIKKQGYEDVKNWHEENKNIHKENIDNINDELGRLDELDELEKEKEERLERQNELLELQEKITNIKNNKNIRQMNKDANGNWQFEYTYDEKALEDANEEYKEKQEALVEWEIELEKTKYKKKLEEQRKYEEEAERLLEEKLAKEQELLDEKHEAENELLDKKYEDALKDTDKYLEELKEMYGEDWASIMGSLGKELDKGSEKINGFNEKTNEALTESTKEIADFMNYLNSLNGSSFTIYRKIVTIDDGGSANTDSKTSISNVNDIINRMPSSKSISSNMARNTSSTVQNINVARVDFPNAVNHSQIESAFKNLSISAKQYSSKTK